MTARRTLMDCPGLPLAETEEAPCRRPLHLWSLLAYKAQAP